MIAASFRGAFCRAAGRSGAGATFAVVALAALLAGCATPPSDPAERAAFEASNDPLEPLNRKTLELNLFLDRILFKPVTKVYIAILPEEGRDMLKRALDNMKEPVVAINNVLQGRLEGAGIAAGRFTINTTLGAAGLFDPAAKWGLEQQSGDVGQTLFVWGLPEGPYLVLPVLGPSSPRDLLGMVGDNYLDPFSYLASVKSLDEISISRFVVGGIDQRARVIDILDDLQKNSLDFYAQLRSLAQQRRAAELRHGKPAEPAPNFYQDPGQVPGAPAPTSPAPVPGPGFYQDPAKPAAAPAAARPAPARGTPAAARRLPARPQPLPGAAPAPPPPTPAAVPVPPSAAPGAEPAPPAAPIATTPPLAVQPGQGSSSGPPRLRSAGP